jgi:hypothetical protein
VNGRRLFGHAHVAEADVRPTLLGVVTLMFLLLFFLLTTSSGVRLGVVALRVAAPGELASLPHSGLVKDVTVTLGASGAAVLVFDVQSTDVSAASTSVERRTVEVPAVGGRVDRAALLAAVERVHAVDRSRTEARLVPHDATTAEELFAVMDVLRGSAEAPMFPRLSVGVE